jgi:chemotaxis protein MotB
MKAMSKMVNFDKLKNRIEMTITPEGLRIELMEDPNGTFFENGSSQPTASLQELLKILAAEAGKLPNPISIEGHTDSTPYSDSKLYGNWELSTDRANTARRLMENNGVRLDQVVQVRGYADHNLRKPQEPNDASNRRVTVIIQYVGRPDPTPVIVTGGTVPASKAPGPGSAAASQEPATTAGKPKAGT